jgi:transcriptional regulator of acetoin/glycerol metabolism
MRSSYNRHAVEKARELFVSTGDAQGLETVSPIIRDSWLRSRALGVDPFLAQIPQVVSLENVQEFLRCNDLYDASQEIVHHMLSALEDQRAVVSFCDRDGRIIVLAMGSHSKEKSIEFNAVAGSGWGEEHIGTDTGTALKIGRPLRIRPGEHYCQSWQDWVTNVTPIHDSFTQEIIGALSVDWPGEGTHPHVFDLLRWGRQILEDKLSHQWLTDRLYLLEQYNAYELRFPADALLALDRQGRVVAINPSVVKLLRQPANTLIGCSAVQALGLNAGDLWKDRLGELTFRLPQSDISGSAEILPVRKQGRDTGGVLVLQAERKTISGKVQSGAWQARYTFHDLKGQNPRFQRTLEIAQAAATVDLSLLLLGESGTGKELFAQAIHSASPRANGPFVPFNCGGVTEELVEAELFGYVEGAFTGALRGGRVGKVEMAHGGTLFLDEVEEMLPKMQVSLLRVLEDGVIVPIGGTQPRQVDVRLIAATNKDLHQKVARGDFRTDLYYRLNGLIIHMPPLRERTDDIPLLAHHILRQGGLSTTLTPETLALLQSYAWPGNIRELKNALLRAGVLAQGAAITPHDLFSELTSDDQGKEPHSTLTLDPFAQAEKACIAEALAKAQDNLSEAAAALGIHRVTLYRKMHRYGLSTRSRGQS